jgi:hypothetical protein
MGLEHEASVRLSDEGGPRQVRDAKVAVGSSGCLSPSGLPLRAGRVIATSRVGRCAPAPPTAYHLNVLAFAEECALAHDDPRPRPGPAPSPTPGD